MYFGTLHLLGNVKEETRSVWRWGCMTSPGHVLILGFYGSLLWILTRVMGLDSLSSFVKHSLTLRAVTQMAGEQYLPAGEEGHFHPPPAMWLEYLAHSIAGLPLAPALPGSLPPEPSRWVVRLRRRESSQPPIHPWPLGIHLSKPACQMPCFITPVVSFS